MEENKRNNKVLRKGNFLLGGAILANYGGPWGIKAMTKIVGNTSANSAGKYDSKVYDYLDKVIKEYPKNSRGGKVRLTDINLGAYYNPMTKDVVMSKLKKPVSKKINIKNVEDVKEQLRNWGKQKLHDASLLNKITGEPVVTSLGEDMRNKISPAMALHEFGHAYSPRILVNPALRSLSGPKALPLAGLALSYLGPNKKARNVGVGLTTIPGLYVLSSEGYASYRALKDLYRAGGKAAMTRGMKELLPAFGTYGSLYGGMALASILLNKYRTLRSKKPGSEK